MDLQSLNNAPKKNVLKIVIAAGVSVLALIFIANFFQEQIKAEQRKQRELEEKLKELNRPKQTYTVLVASRNIPEETVISAGDLESKQVPPEAIQPGTVTSASQVIGLISNSKILQGEQISSTKLMKEQVKALTIKELTPPGKRAVSVNIENMSALAGLLQPGDYIDVFAAIAPPADSALYAVNFNDSVMETDKKRIATLEKKIINVPLFQNVLVLAVAGETSASKKKEKASANDSIVTLALSPQESAIASFVQEQGKIRLILRSNSDFTVEDLKPAGWDELFRYLYPDKQLRKPDTVEIYRGLKKEVVPLITTEEKK